MEITATGLCNLQSAFSRFVSTSKNKGKYDNNTSSARFRSRYDDLQRLIATLPAQDRSFLTNGLVAYYPLNGDASDASGNGNDGVVHGAVPAPDRFGVVGGCFGFDGNGQYISASADRLPTTTRTISLWFKANRADNRPGFLGYGGSFCGDSFFFGLNFVGIEAYWIATHCDVYPWLPHTRMPRSTPGIIGLSSSMKQARGFMWIVTWLLRVRESLSRTSQAPSWV